MPTPARPLRRFLGAEGSASVLLLGAAVVALAWANSRWGGSYTSLWHTNVGPSGLPRDLEHWVDDALMTVFFFVVGLEVKHELVEGRLRERNAAALPAVAAVGGMVVPALLFLAVNAGGHTSRGWGIPMATDIAFALGVVAVVGRGVPPAARLFLLTLAVVDDVGAILVIAVFYSSGLELGFLLAAAGLVVLIAALKRAGVVRFAPYLVLGLALWFATYRSGVHATIAGVVLGLLTPAAGVGSPATRLAHALQPWSNYVVLPVFALANAGVRVRAGILDAPGASAVAAGIVLGLVAGKALGITGAVWLASRTGLASLPAEITWPTMGAIALVAGIGFTVSLFVAELAFPPGPLQDAARTGVLAASTLAAVLGGIALRRTSRAGDGHLRR